MTRDVPSRGCESRNESCPGHLPRSLDQAVHPFPLAVQGLFQPIPLPGDASTAARLTDAVDEGKRGPVEGDPRGDDTDRERRRLERIIPEIVKRIVEAGYDKLSEGSPNVRSLVSELKLPKEALQPFLAQLEEFKSSVSGAVAGELRNFLQKTTLGEELVRALTGLTLQVKTEVRFVPNDRKAKPTVRSECKLSRTDDPTDPGSSGREEDESATASRSRQ